MSPFALLDPLLSAPPPAEHTQWLSAGAYAHRGLHGGTVIENSLSAFSAAVAAGFGIECDVQVSSDGRAVVFHDWELDRLTAERGRVRARSAEALSRVALKGTQESIPTLRDLLALVDGRVPLLVEIKSRRGIRPQPLCRAVWNDLRDYDHPAAVMSFDPRAVRWFAVHAPRLVRGLVVSEQGKRGWRGEWQRHSALWHARAGFLAYDIRDLPSRFPAAQRRRGLPVLTWTVRTPEHLSRAANFADAPIFENAGLLAPERHG